MWTYVKLVLGVLLMLMSIVGTFSFISGDVQKTGMRIVENGVDAVGIIEKREQVTVAARWGRIGGVGRYYTMTYSFTTKEGEKYSGEIDISKEQAYAVEDGQEITVRYYSGQPTINAPLGFKEYMTEADAMDVPWATIAFSTLLFFCLGLYLVWSSWRRIRPPQSSQAASASPRASRPRAVAPAQRAGPMFGGR